MARTKKKAPVKQTRTIIEKGRMFRLRYQDGVVELGIGSILLFLTLLNLSEYFFSVEDVIRLLTLLQPILSLVIFAGGVLLIHPVRNRVLAKREDVKKIPLSKPMLWINLVMLLLLITAPLVWPVNTYDAVVMTWVLGCAGCAAGFILLIVGMYFQFLRFMLIGVLIFVLTLVFSFVGQPGSLMNQMVILVGVSVIFLISGTATLSKFMQAADPYR